MQDISLLGKERRLLSHSNMPLTGSKVEMGQT